ncbi:MAG: hypothetical protein AB8H86_20605 [Polyangiales bacterium]
MRPLYYLTLAGLMLAACTVDGNVIDDLPCECADDFVCDVTTNRCVPAGTQTPDAAIVADAGPDAADADAGPIGGPDAGLGADSGPDGGPDSGPDSGPVRDPDLGECIAGAADLFSTIDDERWGSTRDSVGLQSIEDEVFVTQVPPDNRSAYSFLFARERVDIRDCAIVIEMPSAEPGVDGSAFFSARITNELGALGIGVSGDELVADYYNGRDSVEVFTATYDIAEHRWFAFRGDAGQAVWLVSGDGREWTEVARIAAPIDLDALQPLFGVGALRDNVDVIEARFDNYNNPL